MNNERFPLNLRLRTPLVWLAAVLLLVGVVIGWTLSGSAVGAASGTPVAAQALPASAQTSRAIAGLRDSYADLVGRVAPAVVTVTSERFVRAAASPFDDDPLLEQFFGREWRNQAPRPHREGALGSGVIVRSDGYILTNQHVIDGASRIRVELPDRRSFDAKVVGSDRPSDLAVLKIDANGLPSIPLGDSDAVRVGDVVLAIGDPLGVGETVTMGIISAKGRATGLGNGSFEDFLQTDAPINQGNSGGALVNTRGELVGINSQILTPSGGNIGIGFAIPARMATHVMQQLIEHGSVRRAMLGVNVQAVTSDLAKSFGLSDVRGALVSAVEPGSPAEKAGIEQGDVILSFDGAPITDSNSLRNRVASSQPGSKATLTILRNGHQESKTAVLAELAATTAASNDNDDERSGSGRYGLAVEPLTPEMADRLGVHAKSGLVIDQVAADSAASDAGLQQGDVIEQVDHHKVETVAQFQSALKTDGNRPALLLVNRQGNELFLALSPRRS